MRVEPLVRLSMVRPPFALQFVILAPDGIPAYAVVTRASAL